MPEITTIQPHPLKGRPSPLKGRPSPVKGQHHLDKRADRLIVEGNDAGTEPGDLLTTEQVAAWLGMTKQWLEIGRSRGYGPPFRKLGAKRVKYQRSDVNAWLDERRHRSTSEYRSRAEPTADPRPIILGPTKSGLTRRAPLPTPIGPCSADWSGNAKDK